MFYPLGILGHPWASLGHLGLRGISGHHASEGPEAKAARFAELKWASQSAWYLIRTPHSQLSNLSSISIESRLCMSFVIFCLHMLYCFDSRRIHLNSQVSCQPLPAMALLCPSSRSGMIWAKDGKNMQTHAIQDTAWHSMVQNRERIRMDKIK